MSKAISMPDLLKRVLAHVPHKGDRPQVVKLAKELGYPKSSVHSWLVTRTSTPGGVPTLKLLEWVEGKEKETQNK